MKPARRMLVGPMMWDSQSRLAACLAASALLVPAVPATRGNAQQTSQSELDALLPASEGDDPIGVDESSRTLGKVRDRPTKPQPKDLERFGPKPPPLRANQGEVLTALLSSRESEHRVELSLSDGLALAEVEMRFESSAGGSSELSYRLAVPEGASLGALEVCSPRGCRRGQPDRSSGPYSAYDAAVHARGESEPLPIAHAETVKDARGHAIIVRAAPLSKSSPLTLHLRWVAPTALRGGVVRFSLPARGMDPRAAQTALTLRAGRGLIDARLAGRPAGEAVSLFDAWEPIEISARAQSGNGPHGLVTQVRCGSGLCARARAWAGPAPAAPLDLVLALDVSPSTLGPARGRLLSAVTELLAATPPGSRVRAVAFAARAKALTAEAMDPAQIGLTPFSEAISQAELGAATRLQAVWGVTRPWLGKKGKRRRPTIVLVGDGGLSQTPPQVFTQLQRAGVTLSVLNVDDRPTRESLATQVRRTGGLVVEAGAAAELASRGRSTQALREAAGALFADVVARRVSVVADGRTHSLGSLRAGEELLWEGRASSAKLWLGGTAARRRAAEPILAAGLSARLSPQRGGLSAVDERDLPLAGEGWATPPSTANAKRRARGDGLGAAKRRHEKCDPRGPARRHSGVSSDDAPLALASARSCRKAPAASGQTPPAEVGAGMPSSPLLGMLRQRIVPVARGCFRRDRAGRSDYSVRAVFVFRLAEREVVSAHVEGKIAQALRNCLLSSIDTLEIPPFSGVVNVRYPLVTEREPLPRQIELSAGADGELDSLFGRRRGASL